MDDTLDVSIVICTQNRSALLAETLQSLLDLPEVAPSWEIVVVDNASTDDTFEVARSFESRFADRLRLIREDELGLSAARNRGIRDSKGRVLIFLDDDAFPAPDWLSSLHSVFQRERVYAAGGPVEPLFRSSLPDWFSDRFLPYLTVWDLGPESLQLRYNEYPRGASMAFRREVFERFGLFSTELGRKPGSLLSCEEIELCLRIERSGAEIVYVPGARVLHIVEGERIDRQWLIARFRAQGASEAVVEWQHAGIRGLRIGLRRSIRRALLTRESSESDPGLIRRCERATAIGYMTESLKAPWRIPRYRPSPEAGPAKRWSPLR